MAATMKTEPKLADPNLEVPAVPALPTASATPAERLAAAMPETAAPPVRIDQVSRIEDKAARIEEKFARSEERMMRVESALEKATIRLEGATQEMNLQGMRDDIAAMRAQLRRKPGAGAIFIIALVAALAGAAVSYALTRYGIPGVLPR